MVNTLNLAHELDLKHLFKTLSTHIIFFAVEVLFATQDGRHRKPEFNITELSAKNAFRRLNNPFTAVAVVQPYNRTWMTCHKHVHTT